MGSGGFTESALTPSPVGSGGFTDAGSNALALSPVGSGGFTDSGSNALALSPVGSGGFTERGCGGLRDSALLSGGLTDSDLMRGDFAITDLFPVPISRFHLELRNSCIRIIDELRAIVSRILC
jgi:hypothetical protein